jgi:hypothetical protein
MHFDPDNIIYNYEFSDEGKVLEPNQAGQVKVANTLKVQAWQAS